VLPQRSSQATGSLRTIVVRMDFPDAPAVTSAQHATFLDDAKATAWVGGAADPSRELRAFYTLTSYGRLTVADPLVLCPGVVRAAAAATSYAQVAEVWDGVEAAVVAAIGSPVTSDDLVIMVWQKNALKNVVVFEGGAGTLDLVADDKRAAVELALATHIGADAADVRVVEHGNYFIVYTVRVGSNGLGDAELRENMAAVEDASSATHAAVKSEIEQATGMSAAGMKGDRRYPQHTAAANPAWHWAGQATPQNTASNKPARFALNGIYGNTGQYTSLLHHELSHALGNGPHSGTWKPSSASTIAPDSWAKATGESLGFMDNPYSPLSYPSVAWGAQNLAYQKWIWGHLRADEVKILSKTDAAATANVVYARIIAHDLGGPVSVSVAADPPMVPARTMAVAIQSKVDAEMYVWLEFRPGHEGGGANEDVLTRRSGGAIVHVASGPESSRARGALLLDTQPEEEGASQTFDNCPLMVGSDLALATHQIYVRVLCKSRGTQFPFLDVAIQRTAFAGPAPANTSICVNGTSDIAGDGTGAGNTATNGEGWQQEGECLDGGTDCKDVVDGGSGRESGSASGEGNGEDDDDDDGGGDGGSGGGVLIGLSIGLLVFALVLIVGSLAYYRHKHGGGGVLPFASTCFSTSSSSSSSSSSDTPAVMMEVSDRAAAPDLPRRPTWVKGHARAASEHLKLPQGWTSHLDPASGNCFFFHEATGESLWSLDEISKTMGDGLDRNIRRAGHPARPKSVLPDGWDRHFDEANRKFYVRMSDGSAQWEKPAI
jgi:hypothetical protein